MKYSTILFMGSVAKALTLPNKRDVTSVYSSSNPVIDSSCPVPSSAQPLGGAYPVADFLGSVVTPVLDLLLGQQVVEDLDAVADQLCVNAQQDPTAGDGICQDTFGAVRDFVDAKTPLAQSQQFGCLLDLLCVANAGPQNEGTCNQLLAGAGMFILENGIREFCTDQAFLNLDCIANRIIGVENLECY
ncbi:hypothetical protein SUNI508_13887 [Seiridium unicorne]|uniref:Uncharacterized protein n=1 Tax=Seiridium unicorne TaxID=138068 RepID=A0ABR2VAM1_9PEZI